MTRGDELTVSHLLEFLHARGHAVDFVTLIEPGQTLRPGARGLAAPAAAARSS